MHDDVKQRLRDEIDAEFGPRPPSDLSEVLQRGRGKRSRILLMTTVSIVLVGTALIAGGLWIGQTISSPSEDGRRSIQPADDEASPSQPAPQEIPENAEGIGVPEGIFADVGGWIAFGDRDGIWALDPSKSGKADSQVQLSAKEGTPKAWSPDGSKLLVLRDVPRGADAFAHSDLFVLNADGTETRLTDADGWVTGGSFSPDGTEVVYAVSLTSKSSAIYAVDARGGDPRTLNSAGDYFYEPTFSPDGQLIAYFDGMGDSGHSLRVMNSDGTGTRVVVENDVTTGVGHVTGLDWSPDGQQLVFSLDIEGVYVVNIDGSGFTEVSSEGYENADPHWSPDGSLISYNTGNPLSGAFKALVIARPDGTRVKALDYGRSGPWNPR